MSEYWWVFTYACILCALVGWATDEEVWFPVGIALGLIGIGLALA